MELGKYRLVLIKLPLFVWFSFLILLSDSKEGLYFVWWFYSNIAPKESWPLSTCRAAPLRRGALAMHLGTTLCGHGIYAYVLSVVYVPIKSSVPGVTHAFLTRFRLTSQPFGINYALQNFYLPDANLNNYCISVSGKWPLTWLAARTQARTVSSVWLRHPQMHLFSHLCLVGNVKSHDL